MHYIYKITDNLNNKVYIGQTNNDKQRWRQHKHLSGKNPVQYIHRAMKKYGIEKFIYQIIDFANNQWQADCLEINYIDQYDSRNVEKGYNLSPGGDKVWNRGLPKEQQPMYGKKQSEYQKKKLSEFHTGKKKKPHTAEWKRNNSLIHSGHLVSEETRKKISEAQIGKIVSEETRQNMSKARLGKKLSQETRKKMSSTREGMGTGENNSNPKLNWELVNNIRFEYENSDVSQTKLAKKYNVTSSNINAIVNNRTWIII